MREVVRIPTDWICPAKGNRPPGKKRIAALADSLRANGQETPITVRRCWRKRPGREPQNYEVVEGLDCYEAVVLLGLDAVDAFVEGAWEKPDQPVTAEKRTPVRVLNLRSLYLYLDDIEVGERLRSTDPEKVAALKASIAEIGLRAPITVSELPRRDWEDDGPCYRLVAGAHRLEAFRQLGEDEIEAFVMESNDQAALWEVDENLARAELTPTQLADHHLRREEILTRMGLVKTKTGPIAANSATTPYARKAAADLGSSERTVRKHLTRGKKIAPEIRAEIAGTDLDKGVVLDELAATPVDQQPAKLVEIQGRPAAAKPAPQQPIPDHVLWLWGRLRDFERDGYRDRDPAALLEPMTQAMRDDVLRIAPWVADLLRSFAPEAGGRS